MPSDDILTLPPPPADRRLAYGSDPNQFIDVRTAHGRGPHPVVLNIHGGYWRSKYDLSHAGHFCDALRSHGITTCNVEYRRVGNPGGGWPGTFDDIRAAYRYILQSAAHLSLDPKRLVVIGHSAGGQLALCLAAHETAVKRAISLAGVVNLRRAFELHLSNDAVVEFMGGKPDAVPDHYREADPAELSIPHARQWLIHGTDDDTVPVSFSRDYVEMKKKKSETAEFIEIRHAGHVDLIDPHSDAFKERVTDTIANALKH